MTTMPRGAELGEFIDVLRNVLVSEGGGSPRCLEAAHRIAAALTESGPPAVAFDPSTLPTCSYLEAALDRAGRDGAPFRPLAQAFAALSPLLAWRRRSGSEAAGASFHHGHANTWMAGPEGMECRNDVVVGATLMQPAVSYPRHSHPPEELYLVMSEGEWFNEKAGWYTPGPGGIVYHEPGMVHAMRAGDAPLLAVWCLWTGIGA